MPYQRETCIIDGYVVSEGQSEPSTCPGCGNSGTFATRTFDEKGDQGEGAEFHGVPSYAQVKNEEEVETSGQGA